jgi:hypothetical protein
MSQELQSDKPDSQSSQSMPFSSRAGCLISVLLAAAILCLGVAAFQIAFRGGLTLHTGQLREVRVWIVQNEVSQGLGYSHMRRVSGSERSGQVCLVTRVDFWLWSGAQQGLNTTYCECFSREASNWVGTGTCLE